MMECSATMEMGMEANQRANFFNKSTSNMVAYAKPFGVGQARLGSRGNRADLMLPVEGIKIRRVYSAKHYGLIAFFNAVASSLVSTAVFISWGAMS